MKTRFIFLPLVLAGLFGLCSCATMFSATRRAELSTVAVTRTEVAPDALEEIYGGDIQSFDPIPRPGKVTRAEFARFEKDNRAGLARIQRRTPADLGDMLASRIEKQLKRDSFFKDRILPRSGNTVTSLISSVRLVRSGATADGTSTFDTEVYADIHLRDARGRKLAGKTYVRNGGVALPVDGYADDPGKLRSAYAAALDHAVAAFMSDLAAKTRD